MVLARRQRQGVNLSHTNGSRKQQKQGNIFRVHSSFWVSEGGPKLTCSKMRPSTARPIDLCKPSHHAAPSFTRSHPLIEKRLRFGCGALAQAAAIHSFRASNHCYRQAATSAEGQLGRGRWPLGISAKKINTGGFPGKKVEFPTAEHYFSYLAVQRQREWGTMGL